ncbi:Glutamate 5-kinase, partial [Coemansia sp. RSA 2598]
MSSGQHDKGKASGSNKSRAGRRSRQPMVFNNDPESFDIHSSSQTQQPPVSSGLINEIDIESTSSKLSSTSLSSKPREDSSSSPSDYLTIQKSNPIGFGSSQIAKPKGVRQDMQPPSSSGLNTPERLSPGVNPASGISQEVGTSSQLDLGAPRPGHSRASSNGNTPGGSSANLRRNHSSLITNVDKHGGHRRRRSKTNLRSKSTSRSRPSSPVGSVCSDVSSACGKSLTIVLKLGTSSICDPVTHMPMLANLSMMVETIVKLKELGHRVVLVSSGAVGI